MAVFFALFSTIPDAQYGALPTSQTGPPRQGPPPPSQGVQDHASNDQGPRSHLSSFHQALRTISSWDSQRPQGVQALSSRVPPPPVSLVRERSVYVTDTSVE